MDETGTHESAPVVGAAAYLARSEQWEAFTAAWTGVLHVGGGSIRTDEPGLSSVSREGREETDRAAAFFVAQKRDSSG